MGSDSDSSRSWRSGKVLTEFAVPELYLTSRPPDPGTDDGRSARSAAKRGVRDHHRRSGAAAHLAGVIASADPAPGDRHPHRRHIAQGDDALLATVQMPGGIPVATMAIGKRGKDAALFAVRISALDDAGALQKKLQHISTGWPAR